MKKKKPVFPGFLGRGEQAGHQGCSVSCYNGKYMLVCIVQIHQRHSMNIEPVVNNEL